MYKNIKYFKGLNALRFIAAYLVVIHHAEQIRLKNELFNLKEYSFFRNGGIAVSFFFVLSGFLISYLLLKELKQTNTIKIKAFYIRRTLRIWPLYFLLVLIGTVLVPVFLDIINHPYKIPYEFKNVILYYIFFSPFIVNIIYGHHLLSSLWSIGVEEIFYIVWAPLFKTFKKHLFKLICAVIVLKISLLIYIHIFNVNIILVKLIKILQFEAMAIGALAAYFLFHYKSKIDDSLLFSKPIQFFIVMFILLKLFANQYLINNFVIFDYIFNTKIISNVLLTISYAWFIVNVSVNKKSIIKLNNKIFKFLGEISYGIYMYHMLIVFGIILLFKELFLKLGNFTSTAIFYIILTLVVILVSYVSKVFFEDYFLKLKKKFRNQNHS